MSDTKRAQSATSSASSTQRAQSATTPNMSPEDRRRWKARLVGAKTPSQAREVLKKLRAA